MTYFGQLRIDGRLKFRVEGKDYWKEMEQINKYANTSLRGLSPRANYFDRAAAAGRRS